MWVFPVYRSTEDDRSLDRSARYVRVPLHNRRPTRARLRSEIAGLRSAQRVGRPPPGFASGTVEHSGERSRVGACRDTPTRTVVRRRKECRCRRVGVGGPGATWPMSTPRRVSGGIESTDCRLTIRNGDDIGYRRFFDCHLAIRGAASGIGEEQAVHFACGRERTRACCRFLHPSHARHRSASVDHRDAEHHDQVGDGADRPFGAGPLCSLCELRASTPSSTRRSPCVAPC